MWFKEFLLNASLLLSIMYLCSFVHKKLLYSIDEKIKTVLFIIAAVFIGWSSMLFGIHLDDSVIFDLRFIPIIIATLYCKNSLEVLIIALMIGGLRFSFGISEAAVIGFANMVVVGLSGIVLRRVLIKSHSGKQIFIAVLVMNTINAIFIALFGVIPPEKYLFIIVPTVFPTSILFSLLLVWIMKDLKDEFLHKRELKKIASIDPLTLLHNRRGLEKYQTSLLKDLKENETTIIVAFIDIDYFKKINDTYGHDAGDKILRQIGLKISNIVGDEDFASRYGGEEFVIIFKENNEEEIIPILENFRRSFENEPIIVRGKSIYITISIGVASCPPVPFDNLIHSADSALYRAKQTGRNKIVF